MSGDRQNIVARPQAIACPKCDARLMFCRSSSPLIDACGFESYSFECKECGTPLAGIIDPYDETLLLSVATQSATIAAVRAKPAA